MEVAWELDKIDPEKISNLWDNNYITILEFKDGNQESPHRVERKCQLVKTI